MINKKLKLLTLIFILALPFYVQAKELPHQDDVAIDKVWNIKFNTKIDLNTLGGNITITDNDGKVFSTILDLGNNSKTVVVTPKDNYIPNKIYTLSVNQNIKSLNGKTLSESIVKRFSITGEEKLLATKYLDSKKYNILSYNGQVDDYLLKKDMLLTMPYVMYWSVQSTDAVNYIGKEIKVYKFTVNNHVLDNAKGNENKSTFVYVMICDNKVIGGYAFPNYSETMIGDWPYSLDGKTLEEETGMSYPDWLDGWQKNINS